MNASEFVAYLESGGYDVHGRGPWRTRCPVHAGESNNSLSIAERDGRVLIHCFSGCETGAVLDAVGLRWPDLFDGDSTAVRRGGARTPTGAVRGGARTSTRAPKLNDVDTILRAFQDAGLTWRCTPKPDIWRCECPLCRDAWLSVRVVDVARTEGREGEPTLVFCANGCESSAIAGALRGVTS